MVTDKIRNHLVKIAKKSGLGDGAETIDMLVSAFVEKLVCFETQAREYGLKNVNVFRDIQDSGALVITYSGSLLSIGPKIDGKRKAEYISIGLRTDVPERAVEEYSILDGDFEIDGIVNFINGPIKSSSGIYKIAKIDDRLNAIAQQEVLKDVTQILIEDFVEVNNTIIEG